MSEEEFVQKIVIGAVALSGVLLYTVLRSLTSGKFVYSVIREERELYEQGRLRLEELRQGSWTKNLDELTSFSSIFAAIVLLVIAVLGERQLSYYDSVFFKILMFVVVVSALSYTLSIQMYNNAVSQLPYPEWTFQQRKYGVTLQVVGWYCLVISIMLCASCSSRRRALGGHPRQPRSPGGRGRRLAPGPARPSAQPPVRGRPPRVRRTMKWPMS